MSFWLLLTRNIPIMQHLQQSLMILVPKHLIVYVFMDKLHHEEIKTAAVFNSEWNK